MASNQSNAGEQGASFENGAPRCDATRRKAKFKSQIKHVVGPFETYICADAWSKAHGCGEDDAAEAVGLADDGDDLPRVYAAALDRVPQSGHVAGVDQAKSVNICTHLPLPFNASGSKSDHAAVDAEIAGGDEGRAVRAQE
jgi:hypothetical protein